MPAFTGSADFQEDAHGNTVEEGEAEACTEVHRRTVRSRSRGLPVEELPRQLGNGELLWGLKAEMFYGQEDRYGDYGSLKKAIVEYINWYNSSRLKEYLHWKSPQEALSNSGTL